MFSSRLHSSPCTAQACSCLYLASFGRQVLDSDYSTWIQIPPPVFTLCGVIQITLPPSFTFYMYKMAIITVGPPWDRIAPGTWKAYRILPIVIIIVIKTSQSTLMDHPQVLMYDLTITGLDP